MAKITIKTLSGSSMILKNRAGDKVAARLPDLRQFVDMANREFFGLSGTIALSWNTCAINAAQYVPMIPDDENAEIWHDIELSKRYARNPAYLIGSVLHELCHAKQFEVQPAEFYSWARDEGALIHNGYFWQLVQKAADYFRIPADMIADPNMDMS